MKRERELAKNTLILSIGSFLPKIAGFITLPILTAYLTKAEYGTYDLISTLVSLLLPALTLQIQSAAFRFLIDCRNNEKQIQKIISTISIFISVISVISLIVLYLVLFKMTAATRILISVYLFVDIIFAAIQQMVRGLGYNMKYSIATILNSFSSMILIIAAVRQLSWGINGLLFAHITGIIISEVYLIFKLKLYKYMKVSMFSKDTLIEMLKYSWPMVPNNLSRWVLNLSDRLIVTGFMGIEANAIYAVANKIPNLLNNFQSAFTFAWQENASIVVKDDDAEAYYTSMFDRVFCLLAGATAMLIATSPISFMILVRGDYDTAYYQMPFLYMGMLFSSIAAFSGGIYVAYKRTKSVGITTIVAAICNAAINLVTIHFIGLYAASISTMISYLILMIYRMVNVLTIQKMHYNIKKICAVLAVLVIMGILSVQKILVCDIINGVIGCGLTFMINSTIIIAMFKKFVAKFKRG